MSYLKQCLGPSWISAAGKLFTGQGREIEIIDRLLDAGFNCPLSSGCGRLFDAVSALLGLCTVSSYDGQAASILGSLVDGAPPFFNTDYRFTLADGLISARQVIVAILRDLEKGVPARIIALKFHEALARIMAETARAAAGKYHLDRVVLSGGVFQNLYLSRRCAEILESCGLKVYTHSQVPCNDAGLPWARWRWGCGVGSMGNKNCV